MELEPEEDEEPTRPAKRSRTSRTLHRKTDHSIIERRRREKINDRLVCLQNTVPACREKAREYLQKKNAAAPMGESEMSERIASDMVLEKLCIISHTVDYVMELRAKLKAYEAQCSCDPKLPITAERDDDAHCLAVHPDKAQCARGSPGTSESSEVKSEETAETSPELGKQELCHDDECEGGAMPRASTPTKEESKAGGPMHAHPHHHHHHHDMWCRSWRPWIPWHARACHMHMYYEPPMYAAPAPAPPLPPPLTSHGSPPSCMPREATPWCGTPSRPPASWEGPALGAQEKAHAYTAMGRHGYHRHAHHHHHSHHHARSLSQQDLHLKGKP